MRHGHFLVMGGFHLIEPSNEERSTPGSNAGLPVPGVQIHIVEQTRAHDGEPSLHTDRNGQLAPTNNGRNSEDEVDAETGHAASNDQVAEHFTILTLEMLRELVNDNSFEIRVREDVISDRSKGDALSKIIFMLQTSWFLTQCTARRVQGLELTQLELTTAALASLNASTFLLWWHKPLGAQAPVRVYLKRRLTDKERNAGVNFLGC